MPRPQRDRLSREEMASDYASVTRPCQRCGEDKPLDAFYARSKNCCKVCRGKIDRARYWSNPNRLVRTPASREKSSRDLQKRMGITLDERDAMLAAQGGVCAVCSSPESFGRGWCTDHDHSCCPTKARSCGKCIRGILCYRCNTLLGHAKDSPEILASAIEYVTTRKVAPCPSETG